MFVVWGSVTYRFCPQETSYGRWGGGGIGACDVYIIIFKVYMYAHYPALALPKVYFYTFIHILKAAR